MSIEERETLPCDTREKRCATQIGRPQEFSTLMMQNAPTYREGNTLITVRLQDRVRQSCDERLMRYWCFSLHRLFLIPPVPQEHLSPAYDLGEYSVASFKILSEWMKYFRLPVFDNTSDAIDSYFLGWKLGAPVFCNLIMTRLCKVYEDGEMIPIYFLVDKAFRLPSFQNPPFKFFLRVYIRAEARYKELSPEMLEMRRSLYPQVLRDFIENSSGRHQAEAPESLLANACDYHVHFDIAPGGSPSGDHWNMSCTGWVDFLETNKLV
ncbi:uncharacterized protein J3D65DRAFT_680088 [Phyllosticta citribraziliensis]|uniref:Uncharacterized protein n=1 Tax=Phyllosticta citribraziliensis TaxID=989973 RepID=A0ABR1LCW3_9PEZI